MKNQAMAIVALVAAFVVTTALIIFLNTQFMNIFKFDFRRVHINQEIAPADSTIAADSTLNALNVANDSTKALDSLKSITQSLDPGKDSAKAGETTTVNNENKLSADTIAVKNEPAQVQNNAIAAKPSETIVPAQNIASKDIAKMDPAAYLKWKKNMAKIMEIMDPKRASQILKTYFDDTATREIFFAMNKKKAAEILSKFDLKSDSLIIQKLTRMQ